MKAINIAILILLSIISLLAQEERKYPRPLNEIEYAETETTNYEQENNEQYSLRKLIDTINITWQKLNGPYGGIIGGLIAKEDTILVSTGYYKDIIFYSTNRGLTWNRSNFKNSSSITDFLFTNYGSIIAAAGKSGLYESRDLINWDKVTLKNIPSNLDILFLGKDYKGGIYFTARDIKKIYYSNDSLKTWKVDFDRDSLYIMNYMLADNGDLYAGGYHKIFVKRRDSTSWVECSPGYNSNLGYNLAQDELGNIYAGSGNRSEFFESKDSGKTWIDKDTANFLHQLYYRDLTYNNGTLITAGWPDYMLSGWGVAISKDKGSTWEYSNEGLLPYSYASRLATSGEDTYLGIHGGGIYRSTNQGEDWHPWMKGLAGEDTRDLIIDKDGTIYAVTWGSSIQKSIDQGETWKILKEGLTLGQLYGLVIDDSGYVYTGGYNEINESGTFRSKDKGETWEKLNNTFSFCLYKDFNNRLYSLAFGSGIYRSSDQGTSWEGLSNGIQNYYVNAIAFDSLGTMYAGSREGILYKSIDDGKSWTVIRRSTNPNSAISEITIDVDGTIYASNIGEGILKSTDRGLTWTVKNNGLIDGSVGGIVIDNKGGLLTFNKLGVFYSKDKGENWINIHNDLTVNNIKVDKDNNIYAATKESLFRVKLPDSITSIEDNKNEQLITEYSLSQNYPNPFNPNTTINYSIPEPGYVTLKIFNTLGEELTTLVNEYKQTGNHQVSFNAKELSSGLYIYQMNANGNSYSKKMVLMK